MASLGGTSVAKYHWVVNVLMVIHLSLVVMKVTVALNIICVGGGVSAIMMPISIDITSECKRECFIMISLLGNVNSPTLQKCETRLIIPCGRCRFIVST